MRWDAQREEKGGGMAEGRMTPEGYLPRAVDGQVERHLATFGAVEIASTK